jgi:lysophospholipase L1-like esterase
MCHTGRLRRAKKRTKVLPFRFAMGHHSDMSAPLDPVAPAAAWGTSASDTGVRSVTTLDRPHPPWRRFVAIGDSFTEGLGDPDALSPNGFRGWADRVAEVLAAQVPDFGYANLAIRGRCIDRIDREQSRPAIRLAPDLLSIAAGVNDVVRRADPDELAGRIDCLVGDLAATGATVLMFTSADVGGRPVLGRLRDRLRIYNRTIRTIARRHGCVVADLWWLDGLRHPAMWSPDRLHFSPLGHSVVALEVLRVLRVEHALAPIAVPPSVTPDWRAARTTDLEWAGRHLAPWMLRRLLHQSAGDGILPKRPALAPVLVEGFGLANDTVGAPSLR